jgi:hypothetical protein
VFPIAALYGTYEYTRVLFRDIWKDINGKESASNKQLAIKDAPQKPTLPFTDDNPASTHSESEPAPESSKTSSRGSASPTEKKVGRTGWSLPSPVQTLSSQERSNAMKAFMINFFRKWRHFSGEPPRGAVCLKGLLSVDGEKGRANFFVVAYYEPKTDKYLELDWRIMSIHPKIQKPRGGN